MAPAVSLFFSLLGNGLGDVFSFFSRFPGHLQGISGSKVRADFLGSVLSEDCRIISIFILAEWADSIYDVCFLFCHSVPMLRIKSRD